MISNKLVVVISFVPSWAARSFWAVRPASRWRPSSRSCRKPLPRGRALRQRARRKLRLASGTRIRLNLRAIRFLASAAMLAPPCSHFAVRRSPILAV